MPIPGSLSQLLPGNAYKVSGALGGDVAGRQIQDYVDSMERARRQDDVDYGASKNKLENDLLDNPMKAAERDFKTRDAQAGSELFQDGTAQKAMRAKMEGMVEDLVSKKGKNAAEAMTRQLDWMKNLQDDIDSGVLDPMDIGAYQKKLAEGKAHGIDTSRFPPTITPEFRKSLAERNKLGIMTRDVLEKKVLQDNAAQNTLTLHREDKAADKERALEVARERNKASAGTSPRNRLMMELKDAPVVDEYKVRQLVGFIELEQKKSLGTDLGDYQKRMADEFQNSTPAQRKADPTMSQFKNAGEYAEHMKDMLVTKRVLEGVGEVLAGKELIGADGESRGPVSGKNLGELIYDEVKKSSKTGAGAKPAAAGPTSTPATAGSGAIDLDAVIKQSGASPEALLADLERKGAATDADPRAKKVRNMLRMRLNKGSSAPASTGLLY